MTTIRLAGATELVLGQVKDTDSLELSDYIPRDVLQEIQDSLSAVLRVPLLFATWDGWPITRTAAPNTFCYRFIRKSVVRRPCVHCDRFADLEMGSDQASDAVFPNSHDCPSGLCDVAVPITVGDRVLGYLLTSQLVNSDVARESAYSLFIQAGMTHEAATEFLHAVPVVDEEFIKNMTRSVGSIVSMVAGLASSYATNAKLATRDPLTGIYNRMFMWEYLESRMGPSRKNTRPFSMVILDIDGFKAINNTYGHKVGDQALQAVGEVIEKSVRPGDIPTRFGGDEFVLILEDVGKARAQMVADRVKQGISEIEIPCNNQILRITASFGVVTASRNYDETAEQLFANAEAALGQAKMEPSSLDSAA